MKTFGQRFLGASLPLLALLAVALVGAAARAQEAEPGPSERNYLNKPVAYWLRALKQNDEGDDRWLRWRAVRALAAQGTGDNEIVKALGDALKDSSLKVRLAAVEALVAL